MSATDPPAGFTLKGWHVLIGFLAFFGADIAVNAAYMVKAYKTFPGEASVTPYEDGIAYNHELALKRAQADAGWKFVADVEPSGAVSARITDRTGAPLRGLHVSAALSRPATEDGARTLPLKETAPGLYGAATGRLSGAWDIEVTAQDARGLNAKAERRLLLP